MSHRVDGRDRAVPADAHLVTDLPTTLSKIEQGYIYPSMRIRKKLAKALGVGPQELWNIRPEAVADHSKKQVS